MKGQQMAKIPLTGQGTTADNTYKTFRRDETTDERFVAVTDPGVEVKLDEVIDALENINFDGTVTVSNEVEVKNDVGNPIPVSAASLPLPTGASTSANQTTGNASLSSIDSKILISIPVPSNSTQTPLGISGVFTGTITSALGYNSISIGIRSNRASAVQGVQIRWYTDLAGTNILKTDITTYNTNFLGIGANYLLPVSGPYFQVMYTNEALAQATFNLYTELVNNTRTATILNGLTPINLFNPAILTRPVNDRLYSVSARAYTKKTLPGGVLVGGAGTTIHPVTAGKTFYMTGYSISAISNNATVPQFVIQDGADVADRIAFIFQPLIKINGYLNAQQRLENNPIPFTTDVRAVLLAGSITASITIWGYEE